MWWGAGPGSVWRVVQGDGSAPTLGQHTVAILLCIVGLRGAEAEVLCAAESSPTAKRGSAVRARTASPSPPSGEGGAV
jgi:hypothetical protein